MISLITTSPGSGVLGITSVNVIGPLSAATFPAQSAMSSTTMVCVTPSSRAVASTSLMRSPDGSSCTELMAIVGSIR